MTDGLAWTNIIKREGRVAVLVQMTVRHVQLNNTRLFNPGTEIIIN